MNAVLKAGVALAVLVEIVSVALIASGIANSNPIVGSIAFILVAIVLTVGCIFWGLKQTAADNGYGKQLLNGLLIGVVAGVLVFAFSMINLTVLFPDYIDQSSLATIEFLEARDLPEEMLQAQVAKLEGRTSVSESRGGLIGTIITSLIVGAIVAVFKRKK